MSVYLCQQPQPPAATQERVCVYESVEIWRQETHYSYLSSPAYLTPPHNNTIDTSVTKTQLKIQDLETILSDFLLPNCSLKTQKGRIVLQIKIEAQIPHKI